MGQNIKNCNEYRMQRWTIYSDGTKEKSKESYYLQQLQLCIKDIFGRSLFNLVRLVWLDCISNVISPHGDTKQRYLYISVMCYILYNRLGCTWSKFIPAGSRPRYRVAFIWSFYLQCPRSKQKRHICTVLQVMMINSRHDIMRNNNRRWDKFGPFLWQPVSIPTFTSFALSHPCHTSFSRYLSLTYLPVSACSHNLYALGLRRERKRHKAKKRGRVSRGWKWVLHWSTLSYQTPP